MIVRRALFSTPFANFRTQFAHFGGHFAVTCHKTNGKLTQFGAVNAAFWAVVHAVLAQHFDQANLALKITCLTGFNTFAVLFGDGGGFIVVHGGVLLLL